jgi:hypothetical protein
MSILDKLDGASLSSLSVILYYYTADCNGNQAIAISSWGGIGGQPSLVDQGTPARKERGLVQLWGTA